MMNIKYLIWSLCLPTSPPTPLRRRGGGNSPPLLGRGRGWGCRGWPDYFLNLHNLCTPALINKFVEILKKCLTFFVKLKRVESAVLGE